LRESPLRSTLRGFYDELEYDLIAAKRNGVVDGWSRLDESLTLDDGSWVRVERQVVDGGYLVGWYVASRYANPSHWDSLIERYYFITEPPENYDPDEPRDLGTRPNLAEQVWLDYMLEHGDAEQREHARAIAERLAAL
jgi:hypothetical protein